jgi:hypothetical protein
MKATLFFAAALVLGLSISAAEIPMKLGLYNGNKNTVIADNVITVNNTDAQLGGAASTVNLNQKAPAKIVLSGESLCEESLSKGKNAMDYSLYVDLTYADGTKSYADLKKGTCVPFSTDTKEWQKKSVVLNDAKAIKQLRIYILYRWQTGKVQFKNLKLEEFPAENK